MSTRCVIGIGCDCHGDQIAGLLVARRVSVLALGDVDVHECSGSPQGLVAAWRDADEVIVVEAMPGPIAGLIERCEPHPMPIGFGNSPTRLSMDLREALLAGPLPRRVSVITIAANQFAGRAGVSPEVARAAHGVAAEIIDAWEAPTARVPLSLPATSPQVGARRADELVSAIA